MNLKRQQKYTSIPISELSSSSQSDSLSISSSSASFRSYFFSRRSIIARLFYSFLPPFGTLGSKIQTDAQGTALSIFLLVVLLFNKTKERKIYTAVGLPALYLLGVSYLIYNLSKVTRVKITFREIICLLGYGLFGHTLTLFLAQFSDSLFLISLIVLTGLSTVRLCLVLFLRARLPGPGLQFLICTPVGILHLLFPIYLHILLSANSNVQVERNL